MPGSNGIEMRQKGIGGLRSPDCGRRWRKTAVRLTGASSSSRPPPSEVGEVGKGQQEEKVGGGSRTQDHLEKKTYSAAS
jgi:hypothetical protein